MDATAIRFHLIDDLQFSDDFESFPMVATLHELK